MNLQGASILVTGGCGLIGSATVDLLLREHDPARILILDNLARGSLANVTQALQDPRVRMWMWHGVSPCLLCRVCGTT